MAKILIADHESLSLGWLRRVLEHQGHEVSDVKTGTFALRMALLVAFDVIIASYEMPDITSVDLVRALRVIPQSPRIIILSQSAPSVEVTASLQSWGVPWLVKPIEESSLHETVNQLLFSK